MKYIFQSLTASLSILHTISFSDTKLMPYFTYNHHW
ncbi:uncharacterized protein METZ01_LOCUS378614 [marine metagenome]|uniref:Uncharacterized protein n=1 Tax=marine metagenome TaxID=408172 RepID=A0A382TUL7_9ZZZZ